jgi:23S rRNA G2069 N7-methylase RlmK/C1962 C5-methylase RlmI
VNLSDYVDTGLFLDHRQTREIVRKAATGKRFLNLFGYTGSFTVYAADGGATETTTVDLSANYLEWAEANLRLNKFEAVIGYEKGNKHQLIRADGRVFVERLPVEPLFDLAVVAPPPFSNSKRIDDAWAIQRDAVPLLNALAKRMSIGGEVFFSTNFRRFKLDENLLDGFSCREISRKTVPEDFRNQRIHRCWHLVREASEMGK